MSADEQDLVRIGELARRAGLPPATLRAWERRYGIVDPQRTESGYRLYSRRDEQRLKRMLTLITEGLAPAEAAARVLAANGGEPAGSAVGLPPGTDPPVASEPAAAMRERLRDELLAFDELAAQRTIDQAVAAYSTEGLLRELILPVMREIGAMWHAGEATVGQEHFASGIVRARILPLARGWSAGEGPLAILACPPGEQHDLGLISFGLLMRERGWRLAFFGADTPAPELAVATSEMDADVVVFATVSAPWGAGARADVAELARRVPVLVGGPGASRLSARELGIELLPEDLVEAADRLALRSAGG